MGLILLKLAVLVACAAGGCARRVPATAATAAAAAAGLNDTAAAGSDGAHNNPLSECHYSEPGVSACIERVALAARGVLARGAPALGVQPLEPLRVPSIRLRQHHAPSNNFKYDAWLTDVTIHGLTDYSFNRLDVYPEDLKVTANISLPLLTMFSEYVILGEFQMLPVESTGKMSINFTQCTLALEAQGARAHRRLVVRDAIVRLRCAGPLRADLMDAHSTTGEMEMITEHIARMHAGDIAGEARPALETALAMVLEDVANKFLKHLPADSVFPK